MVRIGVVLSGCGYLDGAEIHEAVLAGYFLEKEGAELAWCAPDVEQQHVVNHLTGAEAKGEHRNVLVESARIARGDIVAVDKLRVAAIDALVLPGGYGAAKNLCTFAKDGANCAVNPDVERVVKGFHKAGKPVAMCCIAPVIAAKVLGKGRGGPGVTVTIGTDEGTAAAIAQMGATNAPRKVTEAAVDPANKVASAPAYMDGGASPWQVYEGIGKMIEEALRMAGPPRA